MSAAFLKVLNMSITASWLILALILTRLLLKKAPKWISCLLWALVAVRLICPFSFESIFSLIPSSQTIPSNIALQQEPAIDSGIPIVNEVVNPVIAASFTPAPTASANPLQIVIPVAATVWIAGIVIMLAYALISFIKLNRSLSVSVPAGEGILACDEVKAPFILGVFRPSIYVPSSMSGKTLDHVIRHERAHLQRHDHWWKPLGFLLLSVYWFNPLCWIAYILLCRDIELACDEKVIRDMDKDAMAAYSQALLDCSFPRKRIAACPLAFGELGVKERVKGVLNYKKPAFWVILIAVIACIVLAVCLMSDPVSNKSLSGKLGVSMDMAVAEHYRSSHADDSFITADYDVLLISESGNETTVYAWVLYEAYSFDGRDVKFESGSHIPVAITFDTTANDNDSATYDVIEYWEPRDGSYYADDIRAKFPRSIWESALDTSKSKASSENCLRAARAYFGVDQNKLLLNPSETTLTKWDIVEVNINQVLRDVHSLSVRYLNQEVACNDADRNRCIAAMGKINVDSRPISNSRDEGRSTVFTITINERLKLNFNEKFDEIWVDNGVKPSYTYRITNPSSVEDLLLDFDFTVQNETVHNEAEVDVDALRAKYPEYFDLSTFKGLEVYVWQMGPNSYSCGVMLGTNRNKTLEELANLKGATIEEMRAILSTYDIDEKSISVIPWQNPVSNYIAEYWISQKDEDPADAETRKQAYIDGIREMLFGKDQ